jgi:DNA-binding NarL/FixJ family response regulator
LCVIEPATRPAQPGVAIVSSDRRIRDGLASLVIASGARVVGTACETAEALSLVGVALPSTVVVDPHIEAATGLAALLSGLRARAPEARILVLAWDGESIGGLRTLGADAIVRVDGEPSAIVGAILPAGSPAL